MADEKNDLPELEEEEVLSNFVDIEDLSSLEGMEEFLDLLDLDESKEGPEAEQIPETEKTPADTVSVDTQEIPAVDELPLGEIFTEESEIPKADVLPSDETLTEETPMNVDEPDVIPELDALDEISETTELDALDEISETTELDALDEISEISELDALDEIPEITELDSLEEISETTELDALGEIPELDSLSAIDEIETLSGAEAVDESMMEQDPLESVTDLDSFEENPDELFDMLQMDEIPVDEDSQGIDALFPSSGEGIPVDQEVDLEEPVSEGTDTTSFAMSDDIQGEPVEEINLMSALTSDAMMEELTDIDTIDLSEEDAALDVMLDGLLEDLDGDDQPAEQFEDLSQDEELMNLLNIDQVAAEEEGASEGKKPGLLKRLFGNIVNEEIAEAERQAMLDEKEKAAIKASEDAKKKEEKEKDKEEKAQEAKLKKEQKKAEKEAKKAQKKAAKEAKKAAQEVEEFEVTGKLNKAGVLIVVAFAVLFLVTEILMTSFFGDFSVKRTANKYFDMQRYTLAYREVLGTDLKKKDPETYEKIKTVMQVQRSLDAYDNYDAMNRYPDALHALLLGIRRYDNHLEKAKELDIVSDMDVCRSQIVSLLQSEYHVTEKQAYELLAMDKEVYTDQVVKIAMEQKKITQ